MNRYVMNFIKIVLLLSIMFSALTISNNVLAADSNQTIEDGVYVIKSALNENLVLDIYSSLKTNDAKLELWQYGGSNNQKYTVKYLGNGYYTISPVHSGKYIDVANNSKTAGAKVLQYQYHGGDNQQWLIKDAGNGYYNIISKSNGLYLDIPHSEAKNGISLQVWTKNNSTNQKFKFEKQGGTTTPTGTKTIDNGTYQIKSAASDKVADVNGSSLSNGGNVGVWENGSTANQKFVITYKDNGYYSICASHSGKYLDVEGSSKTSGTNVDQWQWHGGNNQLWVIKDAGDGYYYIISKCNGLYLTVSSSNLVVAKQDNSKNQKFKFEKPTAMKGTQTISNGTYVISSAGNSNLVFDIPHSSKSNGEKLELWKNGLTANQKYVVKYLDNGYYTITPSHSSKSLGVANGSTIIGTNVTQFEGNAYNSQQWIIKDAGNGYYYIISKNSELYLTANSIASGSNLSIQNKSNSSAQKFKFTDANKIVNIDSSKYPGYKEAIEKLIAAHPNWNFKFLYTGIKFSDAVAGETAVHSRNLVETSHSGEWICSVCGTKLYDSGWYCASEKATAYYMDPRNFLDEVNVFQFLDVNSYSSDSVTLDGITQKVEGSFLEKYAKDIQTACMNTNTNPYYIIARLFQEQGKNGTTIEKGMDGGNGKTYYNPFNIGANGNESSEIYKNALARAKSEGWDSMEKAIEGGIAFCKKNWLENYQNTLYQNKFDIDSTNGSSLYTHQYMQNLMGAYSEARTLQSMYKDTNKLNSSFTFIIPVYEKMDSTVSEMPEDSTEAYPINVQTTGTNVRLRSGASSSSSVIMEIKNKGTSLLSIERGINSDWQKIVTSDGTIGYISGSYLKQVSDVKTCNYKAKVKTTDGDGCNIRIGPGLKTSKLTALADGDQVTVIDDSTYKGIDGYDWYRVIIIDGRQAFIPGKYLSK